MDHNEFQLDEDLIDPFKNFMNSLRESTPQNQRNDGDDEKPQEETEPMTTHKDSLTQRDGTLRTLKNSQSLQDIDTGKLNIGALSHRQLDSKPKVKKLENQDPQHFDIRNNYNLITHCSKIDESFVDYMLDSENGNFVVYFDQSLYEAP